MSVVLHCAPINAMGERLLVNEERRRQQHNERLEGDDNLNLRKTSKAAVTPPPPPPLSLTLTAPTRTNLKPPTRTTNHKQSVGVERESTLDQPNYYYHRPSVQNEEEQAEDSIRTTTTTTTRATATTTMLFAQHPLQEHEQLQSAQTQHKQRTAMQLLPQQPTADNRHRLSTIHTSQHSPTGDTGQHLLQPTSQLHPKMRSFSHSNTFVPSLPAAVKASTGTTQSLSTSLSSTGSSPSSSSGRHSAASSCHEHACEHHKHDPSADTSQLVPTVARPRRLSRIEHRQSLHELGYGKIESYFKLQRLGKGTYATVYMGRSRLSNDLVALKEILKEHDEGAPCTAIREVSLLRLLLHNNIVTLHDICHTPKKLTLVFEYVGPDLYAYMKENNNLLSIHNVRLLLYQLLRGISFCHSRQVLHRDLKPQNLLINSRGELKICDFGLARAKSIPTKSYSNEVVTLWYRPPDVLLGNTDYDHSIDMWGVGCIFYEMASGRTFFPGSSVRQQLYLIFSSLGAPNAHNWPEILQNPEYQSYSFPPFRPEKLAHRVPRLDSHGLQLLMSFLRFKPSERISADEARRHQFFSSLPEQIHHLSERESIFDLPGIYMTLNPGQKLGGHHM